MMNIFSNDKIIYYDNNIHNSFPDSSGICCIYTVGAENKYQTAGQRLTTLRFHCTFNKMIRRSGSFYLTKPNIEIIGLMLYHLC